MFPENLIQGRTFGQYISYWSEGKKYFVTNVCAERSVSRFSKDILVISLLEV